ARTIADLEGSRDVRQPHIAEAVSYRLAFATNGEGRSSLPSGRSSHGTRSEDARAGG
ncbi:MAG: hypothetical protein GW902_07455, partial [Alphaproteobacteria bacterium]|nr:hypothetical protein [Alphaproteobacteria bacterium]